MMPDGTIFERVGRGIECEEFRCDECNSRLRFSELTPYSSDDCPTYCPMYGVRYNLEDKRGLIK